jgi:LmbE family N-acetylglucosaminyl deacetylase
MLKDIPQEQLVRHATAIIREFQPDVVFTFDARAGWLLENRVTRM